eukprot:SM000008S22220  [mRNA]  locus=s8:554257:555242:+ [translate_table: standard]
MAALAATSALAVAAAAPAVAAAPASRSASVVPAFSGLRRNAGAANEWALKTTSNGSKTNAFLVWPPYNNPKFETLSYLPPLSDEAIAKEIDYLLLKGWIPCIEFDEVGTISRYNNRSPGYYDGRYWTMWKLPMFGCNDSTQVLQEVANCKKEYPKAFIRVIGFDRSRQVQCCGFIVAKPQ